MRVIASAALWACAAALAAGQVPAGADGPRAAASSLRRDARALTLTPEAPARAGRIILLTDLAQRLDPNDPQTAWLQMELYELEGRWDGAAAAAGRLRRAHPEDHALARRWLALRLRALQDAESRGAFLASVADEPAQPQALRAQAAFELASIRTGQGQDEAAGRRIERACELDPYHAGALRARLARRDDPPPVEAVRTRLRLLRANPRDASQAWDLGRVASHLGLHTDALVWLKHAEDVLRSAPQIERVPAALLGERASALLDAGRADEAAELLAAAIKTHPDAIGLKELLLEARRASKKDDSPSGEQLVAEIWTTYRAEAQTARRSADPYAEAAWFCLVGRNLPNTALQYARRAAELAPDDPAIQRVLGAAEVAVGGAEAPRGAKRLQPLVETDAYAAAALARYRFEQGEDEAAAAALRAGAKLGHGGRRYRMLGRIAAAHDAALPPTDGAEAAQAALRDFDARYRRLAVAPQEFLCVTLAAAAEAVAPGEPIRVEATLENIGPIPVVLGPGALCRAELRLTARAGGSEGPRFEDLPLLRWPAPRSLAPHERLTQTAQVDLAGLAAYLRCRPLEQVSVTIEGVFSPEGDSQATHSALPGVSVAAAAVTRRELLASFGVQQGPDYAKAYRRGLGYVVRDMRRGTTDDRLRAARQIASLLALVRDVELQRQKLRAEQYDVVTRPVLLSMTRAMLQSDLPAAQAEMLAALTHVPVTRWTVGVVLNAAADDPSALVRFRLAEFLGAAAPQFSSEPLAELTKDTDPLVRRLARALRPEGEAASDE